MRDTNMVNESEIVSPAEGHIVKIKFNTGKELDVNKNDTVFFVGPNNAGKSQSLSDIYQLSNNKAPTVVVSDIEISKEGSLKQLLEATSIKYDNGHYIQYSTLNHSINYHINSAEHNFTSNQFYGEYRNWFVTKLDTEARLSPPPPHKISEEISRRQILFIMLHLADGIGSGFLIALNGLSELTLFPILNTALRLHYVLVIR